ncbi:MAG: type II secretion system protein M [Myxococcales bacterium]|nr:type II secretion system protein M [Myxococcales bacterium]
MEKLRTLISDAQASFARLTERERRLVGIAALAVVGFVVFLIAFSFSSSADAYRRRTQDKLSKLGEVQALAASYRDAEQQRQGVERQLGASNIRLISYVEEKGTAAGLDIPTINPKADVTLGDGKIVESAVELTLTDISLGRLVDFLSLVEAGPGVVKVKNLRVEPRVASETLTAWVTIATYRLK